MNCARRSRFCAANWKVSRKMSRLDPELRDRAGSMLEEVVHLGKIVEQLFTLSRLDAGEAQTEWTRFDLAELAKTTAEQMSLLAEDKGISISCDASQPVPVKGDRVRLKQVVVNLLDNAIKYTPAKGRDSTCACSPSTATPCWKWRTTASAFRPMRCRTSSSGFIAWIRRAPPIPKARAWDFPSSNPFAPRTARKWKCKAPSAPAVVFASGCLCPKTENFTRLMKFKIAKSRLRKSSQNPGCSIVVIGLGGLVAGASRAGAGCRRRGCRRRCRRWAWRK